MARTKDAGERLPATMRTRSHRPSPEAGAVPRKDADRLPAKARVSLSPGEMLRELRELHGMTQNELAKASGIDQPVISAMEHGRVALGVERAKKLAGVLKVHPAVLVFSDWEEASGEARGRPVARAPVARRGRAKAA
jgi:ribosome-binding protein aMBF1 (putative translation factor)